MYEPWPHARREGHAVATPPRKNRLSSRLSVRLFAASAIGLFVVPLAAVRLAGSDLPVDEAAASPARSGKRLESGRKEYFTPQLKRRLAAGVPQSLLVLFDAAGPPPASFARAKEAALVAVPGIHLVRDYPRLPVALIRVDTAAALRHLLERPEASRLYEDGAGYPLGSSNLSLIGQPQVAAAGRIGAGTAVAILDNGIDASRQAFGNCGSGVTGDCRIGASVQLAPDNHARFFASNPHGTNVAGIVGEVAPGAELLDLNVFRASDSYVFSDLLGGIEWTLEHRAEHNIVAMNMSVGGGPAYRFPCTASLFTPVFAIARASGVLPVLASGNEGFANGLTEPACVPGAISVGAVYEGSVGRSAWSGRSRCTDPITNVDQLTCFSNRASYLTMLAPGVGVAAAGTLFSGTSQAAPHVSGALAVLRSAFPSEPVDETLRRLVATGAQVTDPSTNLTKPRIDLPAALAAPPARCESKRISLPATLAARLLSSACSFEIGGSVGYYDFYRFDGVAGQTVDIRMSSPAFDTVVSLYGPRDGGKAVASNDDASTEQTDSFLRFRLTETGTWGLAAYSSAAAETGPYTLSVVRESANSR
jgi:subtilisin family serine protease